MPPPYEILSDSECECDEIYCACDECYTSDESSHEEWSPSDDE